MKPLRFAKMSGAANDFVVIDNRGGKLPALAPGFIRKVCTRRFSVGADGLMILSPAPDADFRMQYYNADGSEAAMCGNGGRCIARFAVLIGAGQEKQELCFVAPSGRYTAYVQGSQVRLSLVPPKRFEQDVVVSLSAGDRKGDVVDTGVPHLVFFSQAVDQEDVAGAGREARQHKRFAPAGTNVNFCQVLDRSHLRVRTYERGVEDETLACGTGAAAAALLAAKRGWVDSPVAVRTQSGLELKMEFTHDGDGFRDVFQTGEARLVYWGELAAEADDFILP